MTYYKIQQLTECNGWVDFDSVAYATKAEALEDLLQFLSDVFIEWQEGHMADPYNPNEFRVVEATE